VLRDGSTDFDLTSLSGPQVVRRAQTSRLQAAQHTTDLQDLGLNPGEQRMGQKEGQPHSLRVMPGREKRNRNNCPHFIHESTKIKKMKIIFMLGAGGSHL
jgi:hypothetical protein